MRNLIIALTAGAALLLLPVFSWAENSTKIPGYTIHHNALTTDTLQPDVASSYNIRRSKNRAMLNVSIIKDKAGTTGTPVSGKVSVKARNLRGQVRDIPMREIKEAEAIYYIGDFLVENQETVTFQISVMPANETATHNATIEQQFFTK